MRRDQEGNKLYRKIWVKIVYPEAIFPPKIMVSKAPPKRGFNEEGIDDILMQTADKLENLFPYWNFKMTEIAPLGGMARYVFTFSGYSAKVMDQVKSNGEAATIAAVEGAQLPGPTEGLMADFK
jgi:hypothetical protein